MSQIREAERLRAQAARCRQLAVEATNRHIADTLIGLASKSLEKAADLEQRAFDRQQRRPNE
jgi:hypothetical protein